MNLVVDLHSHSPYAGASGKSDFKRLSYVMGIKGINIYGSGDILLKKWEDELDAEFRFDRQKSLWSKLRTLRRLRLPNLQHRTKTTRITMC